MAHGKDQGQQQMSQIQRQIQQDWANREYIELMTCSIKKITDFLNSFGKGSRSEYARRPTFIHSFIHTFMWKIYIALPKKSTQRRFQSNHGEKNQF